MAIFIEANVRTASNFKRDTGKLYSTSKNLKKILKKIVLLTRITLHCISGLI